MNFDSLPIYSKLDILISADHSTFVNLCQTDKLLHDICIGKDVPGFGDLTNYLYNARSQEWFPEEILNFKNDNYPQMDWKFFYERINNFLNKCKELKKLYDNINPQFPIGFLPLPIPSRYQFNYSSVEYANSLAGKCYLMELKLLAMLSPPIYPNEEGANKAILRVPFCLNVLNWMKENNLPMPTSFAANRLAERGDIHMLNWMKENDLPMPTSDAADTLAENGNLYMLNWMKENDLPLPSEYGINAATAQNRLGVLKWMHKNNLLGGNIGNIAAAKGSIDILNWIKEENLPLPNVEGANSAIYGRKLKILKWMKEHGLPYPDQEGIEHAILNNYDEIVDWIKENNLI